MMYVTKPLPANTAAFSDAAIVFCSLVKIPTKALHSLLPPIAQSELFCGIAKLPPIIPNKMIVQATQGKAHFPTGTPVSFSLFGFSERQTMKNVESYWNKILEVRNRYAGRITHWSIAPDNVAKILMTEFAHNRTGIHYYDPCKDTSDYHFGITVCGRIKTYIIPNNKIIALN